MLCEKKQSSQENKRKRNLYIDDDEIKLLYTFDLFVCFYSILIKISGLCVAVENNNMHICMLSIITKLHEHFRIIIFRFHLKLNKF